MHVSSPVHKSILQIGMAQLSVYLPLTLHCRWLFEKYDGIRGFWNPLKKTMFSRSGKRFDLPQEIIDSMPQHLFLDGELWYAYSAPLPAWA